MNLRYPFLHSFSIKDIVNDKIELRLFYFDVSKCMPLSLDTGCKLNVHKTFRKRPGCLLLV